MKAATLALGLVLLLVQEGKAVVKCVQGAIPNDCADAAETKCFQYVYLIQTLLILYVQF